MSKTNAVAVSRLRYKAVIATLEWFYRGEAIQKCAQSRCYGLPRWKIVARNDR